MPFKDQTGATALPTLTPDGAVPVAEQSAEGDTPLLLKLIWEIRALRRAFCDETGQRFDEYE